MTEDSSNDVDDLIQAAPEDSLLGEMADEDLPRSRRTEVTKELLSPVSEEEFIESQRPPDLIGEWEPSEDKVLAEKIAVEEAHAEDEEGGLFSTESQWEALKKAAEFNPEEWDYKAILQGRPRSEWKRNP